MMRKREKYICYAMAVFNLWNWNPGLACTAKELFFLTAPQSFPPSLTSLKPLNSLQLFFYTTSSSRRTGTTKEGHTPWLIMQSSDLQHKGHVVGFQAEGHRKSGERFGNPFQTPHHNMNLLQKLKSAKMLRNLRKMKQQQSVAQHSFYMAYQFLDRSGKELKIT